MDNNFEVVRREQCAVVAEDFNGGSLKGYVRTDFQTLCETFGPPTYGPFDYTGDKVTCEWKIITDEGLFVTIYDWKMGETPLGTYDWHIGGQDMKNVEWVGDFGLYAWRWK